MKKKIALAGVIFAAAAGFASVAMAENGPNLIEVRQVAFSLMSGDFGGINAVVAAKADTKPLEARAKAIARYAAIIPAMFPVGTSAGNNTKALPEIWSDNTGFQKAAANLGAAATKLAETSKSGDLELIAADVKAVGAACGACHNTYRAK